MQLVSLELNFFGKLSFSSYQPGPDCRQHEGRYVDPRELPAATVVFATGGSGKRDRKCEVNRSGFNTMQIRPCMVTCTFALDLMSRCIAWRRLYQYRGCIRQIANCNLPDVSYLEFASDIHVSIISGTVDSQDG